MAVAQKGEQSDPRIPAPDELRPILRFARLSAAAYGVIARVIDEDGIFRARVADAAEEAEVGRASWLWLHRPVGWLDDPAIASPASPPAGAEERSGDGPRGSDKAAANRLRRAVADAEAARRRAIDQLAEVRRSEVALRAERDELTGTLEVLRDERNAAVRRSKDVEAQLATTRRDLKLARQATTEAEAELAALRSAPDPAPADPGPAEPVAPTPSAAPAPAPVEAFDRAGVAASVAAAATAATELATALAEAAGALAAESPAPPAPPSPPVPEPADDVGGKGQKKRGKKQRKGSDRVHPTLPPGVFDGTPEAHRALLADAANLLVVDGYNVARAAWSGLAPEEERRRTVALLDDVQARSGGRVVVVFDGDDAVTAPKASKSVRVRFSATGQTADDAIVDLLAATGPKTPVVVVSSDRAVATDARRQGAVAVGSRDFLVAAGR